MPAAAGPWKRATLNDTQIAAAEAADAQAQPGTAPVANEATTGLDAAPAAADEATPVAEETAALAADDAVEDEVPEYTEEDEPEPPRTTFADLGLSEELLRAVSESGYVHPTPIQENAIPWVLMGRDVLGCAQTGTGKTASFVLPMMDILAGSRAKARMPRSLILEPTRELALQVAENFEKYGKYLKLNHALLIGGESMNDQRDVLEKGVDVLIATPGRLLDLFDRGRILMADCKLLVIDEADRMLDMGFIPDVERIVSLLPQMRQTLFFSATMAPEIRKLADAFLSNPKEITVAPPASVAATITTGIVFVQPHDKREALRRLIRSEKVQNALIFCNKKIEVDILYKSLKKHRFSVGALHGDMDQASRFATLNAFKAGELQLLVCSDVAARGIDIGGLSHVFNFDVPFRDEDYVHRIGRTGRAGREGHAYTIATADDAKNVAAIEKLTGKPIPRMAVEGLDVVPEEEIEEARNAPKGRGRGASSAAKGRGGDRRESGRRDGSRRDGPPRDRAPRDRDEAAEARPRRERERDEAPADAAPRRERDRDRDRSARIERETAEAARTDREPRRERERDRERDRDRDRDRDGRERRYRQEDLGPAVKGFGDAVPAFMLIPLPRPRAEKPAAPEAAPETEAA
ncbi:DEAD/DEAH box helicase [Neoroseomonas marina]|uniref:DEAD/DEAH box helicase n=1 Tax=Neoroseomonas marina TaxID=1232220 RepID=UPI001B7D7239